MKRHVDPSEGTKKLKSKNKKKGKKPKTPISQIKLMHSLWSFFFVSIFHSQLLWDFMGRL